MQTYSTIAIKDKEVYLMVNDTGQFKLTKQKSEAIAFNTDKQAKEFGRKYFNTYLVFGKDWEVKEIEVEFEK